MPVACLQDKTFRWLIQYKIAFVLSVIVVNPATSFQTNGRLYGCFMPVPATKGFIYAVDIKYPFYFKRNCIFNHGEIASFVDKRFQVYEVGHCFYLILLSL